MGTRANIYIQDVFVGEIIRDAYPDGDLWIIMEELNGKTLAEFKAAVTTYIHDMATGIDRSPLEFMGHEFGGESGGVLNWAYEYVWVATTAPEDRRDWDNWAGRVLVRRPNYDLFSRLGAAWTIPGELIPIEEWYDEDEESDDLAAIKGSSE